MIHQGDCLTVLRTLPDNSVQCVVTSPPYWGLRDYGVVGQLGLEASPDAYVSAMVAVFVEVQRVLKRDGVRWLNLGDCYAAGAGKVGDHPGGGTQGARWKGGPPSDKSTLRGNGHVGGGPKLRATPPVPSGRGVHQAEHSGKHAPRIAAMGPMTQPNRMPLEGLKPKDLVGIPWRVAFALQAAGWYLRSDIIWSKPNPMPESVQDRPTKAHEYIFLLTKSARYYYDAAAIREPYSASTLQQFEQGYDGEATKDYAGTGAQNPSAVKKRIVDKQRGHGRRHAGFNDRWDGMSKQQQQQQGANKRSVWTVATHPFPGAHFATFPEDLIQPCVLAGSRPGDIVLDPFTGSGTVGVVCAKAQRQFIGIELNPEYVALAEKRIADVAPLFAEASA